MSNGWVPLSLGRVEPGPDPAARMCYPREKRGGLRLMQDVTELINNHRECSRHLWNVYFGSQENTVLCRNLTRPAILAGARLHR